MTSRKQIAHHIYFRDNHPGSTAVLRYVRDHLQDIRAMGVVISAHEVPARGGNPRQLEYLRRIGVNQIPALATPTGIHLGAAAITRIYADNLRQLAAAQAVQRRKTEQKIPSLDDYYETVLAEGDDDVDEPDLGAMFSAAQSRRQKDRKGAAHGGGGGDADADPWTRPGGTGEVTTQMPAGAMPDLSTIASGDSQDDLMMAAFMTDLVGTS